MNGNDLKQATVLNNLSYEQATNQESELIDVLSAAEASQESLLAAREAMLKDLSNWGGGLILIGIAHIAFASFLDPGWGVILIILGVLVLAIKTRAMFVVIGLGLWLAAYSNLTAGISGFWFIFGIMQIFWGLQEMAKFLRYRGL
jgi:hypothetical protein